MTTRRFVNPTIGQIAPQAYTNSTISSITDGQYQGQTTLTDRVGATRMVDHISQPIIGQEFVLARWAQGQEKNIRVGNLVFISKKGQIFRKGQAIQKSSLLNIADTNHQLRHNSKKSDSILKTNYITGTDADLFSALKDASESSYDDDYFKQFYRDIRDSGTSRHAATLLYNSPKQINDAFVPIGVVESSNDMTNTRVINATVGGMGYVDNIWGDKATPGTYLYVILRRQFNDKSGRFEEFAYVPYVSADGGLPKITEYKYEGTANYSEYGIVWKIGQVLDNEFSSPSSTVLKKAAGLIGDSQSSVAVASNLKTLKILVDIKQVSDF